LHRCRRGDGHRTASWHPTIDVDVERYEIEQRLQRLESENARLAQINSRLERFEREHLSGSTPPPSTGDGCF
jgi:hypothetical protein